jgi:hypothetical protein
MLDAHGPEFYAKKLATYIKDASTIRSRTLDYFGRAPSLDHCSKLIARAEVGAQRSEGRLWVRVNGKFRCGHSKDDSNILAGADGVERCLTCRRKLEAEASRRYRENRAKREAEQRLMELAKQSAAERAEYNMKWQRRVNDCALFSEKIIIAAEAIFAIPQQEFLGHSKAAPFVNVRYAIAMVSRDRGFSFPQIARIIKRKDHTTIINAVEKAQALYIDNRGFRIRVEALRKAVA